MARIIVQADKKTNDFLKNQIVTLLKER